MRLTRWQNPEVASWPTVGRLSNLRDEIDRLFDLSLGGFGESSPWLSGWIPALDVFEEKDQFVVKAELPGMKKDDIEVTFHNGSLSISGERKSETESKEAGLCRAERYFGRFQRSVDLPTTVQPDKVNAEYRDGVLTIALPKAEEAKPKEINVKFD